MAFLPKIAPLERFCLRHGSKPHGGGGKAGTGAAANTGHPRASGDLCLFGATEVPACAGMTWWVEQRPYPSRFVMAGRDPATQMTVGVRGEFGWVRGSIPGSSPGTRMTERRDCASGRLRRIRRHLAMLRTGEDRTAGFAPTPSFALRQAVSIAAAWRSPRRGRR